MGTIDIDFLIPLEIMFLENQAFSEYLKFNE